MSKAVAVDLEMRLLGLCLTSAEAAAKAVSGLTEQAFVDKAHRRIFAAIRALVTAGRHPSPIAVAREAGDADAQRAIEAALEQAGMPAEADALIEALREAYARRALIAMAEELRKAAEEAEDFEALQELAAKRAMSLSAALTGAERQVVHVREAITDVLLALQGQGPAAGRRLPFGFYLTLGRVLRGLQAARLYVLAARPSMGKTALALQIAWQAIELGKARNVLFVSLEMSAWDLAARLIAQRSGVNVDEAMEWPQSRRMELVNRLGADEKVARLAETGLWVCERRGLRASEIVALAHRVAAEQGGLDLLVVDHLGLVALPGGRDRTTAEKLGEVTRTLRRLAGDLDMPVLVIAQLNRDVEHRDDKRPTMADLRGSGEIEQDADVVLGLYRHRYYEPDLPDSDPRSDKAEVWVLKNRNGESGMALILRWVPQFVRFEECSQAEERAYQRALREAA